MQSDIKDNTKIPQQSTIKTWQNRTQDLLLEKYFLAPGLAQPLPKHSHADYQIGLSFDTDGGYFYRGSSYPVAAGSFSIIHSGEVHTTTRKASIMEVPRTYRMLYVNPNLFRAAAQELTSCQASLPFFKTPVISDRKISSLFIQLCNAVEINGSRLEVESLTLYFLTQLIFRYGDTRTSLKPIVGREYQRIERAIEYIESHLNENISLELLAKLVHISPFHLNRLFCKQVGIPPHQYQIQRRVDRAKALLRKGLPVKKIVKETGFTDQSHLTKHFKRFVQVTPGRYLRQL